MMTSFPVCEVIIAAQTKSNFKENEKIPLSKNAQREKTPWQTARSGIRRESRGVEMNGFSKYAIFVHSPFTEISTLGLTVLIFVL